ncbi:SH3 domain-containing protein, partial [Pelagibacteraceae bacterium]|nr:SH3 domain-containing protein [Pelagibacteraceae bacterium]
MRNNLPVLNVYKKKTKKSAVVTQLLYGDTFKKLGQYGSWIKIKNDSDKYKGYIVKKKFFSN